MDAITASQDPSSMNKWLGYRMINKIRLMEDILAIFNNPMMTKPIEELGLKLETVQALKDTNSVVNFGAQLVCLSKDTIPKLSLSALGDIIEVLIKNKIEVDLPVVCDTDSFGELISNLTKSHDHLTRRWIGSKDSELFNNNFRESISLAEVDLLEYKEERDKELARLHIVKIVLPETLELLGTPEQLTEAACKSLHVAFSKAVDATCQRLVLEDLSTLRGEVKPENDSWLDALLKRVSTALRKPTGQAKPNTNEVISCLSLEFAVCAQLVGEPKRLEMLKPIFAKVAQQLSGTVLAQDICNRLSLRNPAPDSDAEPYDWICVEKPYENAMK